MMMRFLLCARTAGNHRLIVENMAFDLMGNLIQVTVGHGKASGKHKQGVMIILLSSGCHFDFDVCPGHSRHHGGVRKAMRLIAVLTICATVWSNRDLHTFS